MNLSSWAHQPLGRTQRKVGTQQPEQVQTSGLHHEIALTAYNRNIYSNLRVTTFINLSPSFEAFELFFSPLSHKPTSTEYWSTTVARAPTPRATPDTASEFPSTHREDISYTTTPLDATRHAAKAVRSSCRPREKGRTILGRMTVNPPHKTRLPVTDHPQSLW
ncbi:hypothetical protein EV426DRAFT_712591 [Tirmania nivea]|nr:hypothetical protein EV426DRAFT_712591 [Tirmania nivea]